MVEMRLIIEKIKNKRIMTLCLVLGLTLLTATISSQPMYKAGALNRLLINEFDEAVESTNEYPTVIARDEIYEISGNITIDAVKSEYDRVRDVISGYLDFAPLVSSQRIISIEDYLRGQKGYPDGGEVRFYENSYENSSMVFLATMPNLLDHVTLYEYEESDIESVKYKCYISRATMDALKLYPGEVLKFSDAANGSIEDFYVIVAGVFEEKDSSDLFFYKAPADFDSHVFFEEEDFSSIVEEFGLRSVEFKDYYLFDYAGINPENVDSLKYYLNEINANMTVTDTITPHLDSFYLAKKSIDITLWVMQLPLLAMILAFIFMVSKQIVGSEVAEIATLKSRGMSRGQVILTYLMQSAIIGIAGYLLGIPLGILMSKISGSATDFLTFDPANAYMYSFTVESLLYALIAYVVGIICILIPVLASSKVSITQVRSDYHYGRKAFWEKFFLDFILLGLSLYFLYNFLQNIEKTRQDALIGEMADPFVFLDTCLFLVAAGLIFLRLTGMIVRTLYRIFKKNLSTAGYVAFLQTIRNFSAQSLISIFIVLTIAMGIFYSNTARTINSNKIERIKYNVGCDMKVKEEWPITTYMTTDHKKNYHYKEPSYGRYMGLVEDGLCESITKVITSDTTKISLKNQAVENCLVYGINTKEFGETAILRDGLNGGEHWYNYLNLLAQNPSGVIISKNLADTLKVEIGDSISLEKFAQVTMFEGLSKGIMAAKVVAIADDFPGYERYKYELVQNEAGELEKTQTEQYLAVINYSSSVYSYEISPYFVWMKLKDNVTYHDVEEYLMKSGVVISEGYSIEHETLKMKEALDIQIVNGMFTTGFIISLLVCAAGLLIYWITSIRQRELQFGVYRAMGMSVRAINKMLITEHLLSTLFSIISGLLEGVAVTLLFEKLFGVVYLPEKHNLDIYMNYDITDYIRLGIVIVGMVVVCILILKRQMSKLNISDALKLGEE